MVMILGYFEVLLIIQYILSKSSQELHFKLELFVQLENQCSSMVQLKLGQNEKELTASLYNVNKTCEDSILQGLSVSQLFEKNCENLMLLETQTKHMDNSTSLHSVKTNH